MKLWSVIIEYIVMISLGFILGVLVCSQYSDRELQASVTHGRINTPHGIYYLMPVPSQDEIEQLRNDVEYLNAQLNKKGRKGK